jgi:hypothetical protein
MRIIALNIHLVETAVFGQYLRTPATPIGAVNHWGVVDLVFYLVSMVVGWMSDRYYMYLESTERGYWRSTLVEQRARHMDVARIT